MSQSEHHKTQPIHPKDAQRITTIALSIIDRVKEPDQNAKSLAKTIVQDFGDVVATTKRISFMEAISIAKIESAPASNQPANQSYTFGSQLASSALKKAAAIMIKEDSFNKAVVNINRVIAARDKTRAGRMQAANSGRTLKPAIPIDGHRDSGGRKHSSKPRYNRHQPNKARQRKAA